MRRFTERRLFDSFPALRSVEITHRWGGAMGFVGAESRQTAAGDLPAAPGVSRTRRGTR